MTVAVDYIESEFGIDQDCFRTLYDQERKAAEVATRGKDEASEEALTANESKIAEAVARIKVGVPRSSRTTATPIHSSWSQRCSTLNHEPRSFAQE